MTMIFFCRATKELEALGQEVSMLHEQMKMVKYDIQKVQKDKYVVTK